LADRLDESDFYRNDHRLLFRAIRRLAENSQPFDLLTLAEWLEDNNQLAIAWVFRHGMPPHGGFAIGLERLLMQLLALPNVRLATLFPRDLNRVTP